MTLWEALSLLPPVAIYNILARSNEHGKKDVQGEFIGSAPTVGMYDGGARRGRLQWEKVGDDPIVYRRIIRKAK